MDYPKRLIEVDLPIKRISAHARREKSIRHGHISTLHIWWARRPLAACRAVICAALWPDPADENCPQAFRTAAARLITEFAEKVYNTNALHETASKESFGQWEGIVAAKAKGIELDPHDPAHLNKLRFALLDFVADFANWDNSTIKEYLETSRGLTKAAHEALGGTPGTRPLVVDPFAGGGSIPLEALRVGADAFASDLNPVAVLLNKVVLEYIPKYGRGLADDVRKWGAWVGDKAEEELKELYPKDSDGSTAVAFLWARTIECEGPACGQKIPMVRSLWLEKKPNRSVALRLIADSRNRRIALDIVREAKNKGVGEGTSRRGSVTCPMCGFTTPVSRVRDQSKKSGHQPQLLVKLVRTPEGVTEFRLPNRADQESIQQAASLVSILRQQRINGLSLIPDEAVSDRPHSVNRLPMYGLRTWGHIYGDRQLVVLSAYLKAIRKTKELLGDSGRDHAITIILC